MKSIPLAYHITFGTRPWWAVGGSVKYIWDDDYLRKATKYVSEQREF